MAEIPVERRREGPSWLWVMAAVGVVAVIALILVLRYRSTREPGPVATATPAATACSTDNDCGERQLCVIGSCTAIRAGLSECAMSQVHFDTDVATLKAADQPQLTRMARCLRADQSIKLTIVGATDERGSAAHNDELGERRARAVASALTVLGVSPQQLRVVSYGDSYPLCVESDAECWAKNRQAWLIANKPAGAAPRP